MISAIPLVGADVAIVKVLWTSVAATVVVALSFALTIRFLVRLAETRALRHHRGAALYGALSAVSLATFVAAILYGLLLLTQKS